jgi:hypothetical protein
MITLVMHERTLYKFDAAFEATLAVVLIAGAATGWLDGFPLPAARPVLLGVGVLLAIVAVYLYAGARDMLMVLALANDVTALGAIAWLLAATGFSTGATVLLIVTIIGLLCLSSTQFWTARRSRLQQS